MMQTTEFKIEDLFVSANGDANLKKSDLTNTGLPLITSGLLNNGIAGLTDKPARVFDGHTITVDMFGNAFYRDSPYKMVTHARVFALLPHGWKMTEKIGLYITTQLCYFKEFFSYGNMCSFKKIKQMTISLPVVPSDDPSHTYTSADIDWKYMQDYIAELEQDYIAELEQDYIAELDAYLKASNLNDTELTDEEKETLKGPEKTKEFKIEELFELQHQTYKATKHDFCDYGKTPVYSSDSKNNGCVGYVSHKPEFIVSNDVPTYLVFGDHTRTRNIVHRNFVGMDNIKVLKPKQELSDCCLLYISTAWLKAIPVLGYARHWSVARAAKFLLPVTSTGTPDCHFMETYITAIEKLTIKDVVKYKNQMIKTTKRVVNC